MKSSTPIIRIEKNATQTRPAIRKEVHDRIVIPSSQGLHIIPFNDIIHCHADSNYCRIRLSSGKDILASKTLKHISSLLPKSMFIRIHQSHLVGRKAIRFIGQEHLTLADGSDVPVSRSRRSNLLQSFGRNQ